MSGWRQTARAAVEREAKQSACALLDDANAPDFGDYGKTAVAPERDERALAEREAIAIADGGLPPSWAAALSMLERGAKPVGIAAADWRQRLSALWLRAEAHGAEFAAQGWTFEEVFGVGEHWPRLDKRGVAWLAPAARIVVIDAEHVVFERGRARSTHHKQERPH